MNKLLLFVAFLALAAMPLPGVSQDAGQEPAATLEAPAKPARRPKMPNIVTFESSVGDVQFPHRVHQKMGCKKCHHQINAEDLVTPHDEYLSSSGATCIRCHDEAQNNDVYYGCVKCHHSNLENIADETLSSKVVLHKNCWNCHLSGTGAEASQRCSECHSMEASDPGVAQNTAPASSDAAIAGRSSEATAN
jgi:hypothetical protein